MGKVASKHFGEIELNHGREHCFVARHELGGNQLELDLNVTAHDHFDEAAMRKVDYRLRFLPELVDQVREMIADELDQDGTNPPTVPALPQLAAQGRATRIGLWCQRQGPAHQRRLPESPQTRPRGIYPGQPERYFVLDFTLGSHFTDELLVVAADEDGVVDDEILWES